MQGEETGKGIVTHTKLHSFAKVRTISVPGKGEKTAFLTKTGQLTYLQDDFSSGVWTTCIE